MKDVVKDYVQAMDDLIINHRPVRQYYLAHYGSQPTYADHGRIVARLKKTRDIRKQDLKREFFGPSEQIPYGRLAFLYEGLEESYSTHEACLQAFRIADNWNSSNGSLSETVPMDNEQYTSPEDTMREWYGGTQQIEQANARSTGYSSSEASERGEYFREYLQWRGEALSLHREIEGPRDSDLDSRLDSEGQLDQASSSGSGFGADETASILVHRNNRNITNIRQLSEATVPSEQAHGHLQAQTGMPTADVPSDDDHHLQESLEQNRARLRTRLDQLDAVFDAPETPCSSIEEFFGDTDSQIPIAGADSIPRGDSPRESLFY